MFQPPNRSRKRQLRPRLRAAASGVFFHSPATAKIAKAKETPAAPQPEFAAVPQEQQPAVEVDLSSEWENDLAIDAPQVEAVQEPPLAIEATEQERGQLAQSAQMPPAKLEDGIEEVRSTVAGNDPARNKRCQKSRLLRPGRRNSPFYACE
jgi:hypothetical protein